jgi:hypothetical protein
MSIHYDAWKVKKCKRLVFCSVNGLLLMINSCIYTYGILDLSVKTMYKSNL